MAAGRAAELTEAYRVLSNEAQRAEYDRTLGHGRSSARRAARPFATGSRRSRRPEPSARASGRGAAVARRVHSRAREPRPVRAQRHRRAHPAGARARREATTTRTQARGFDIALVPKPRLFGGGKRPRLLGRFIEPVDGAAVAEAWPLAVKMDADRSTTRSACFCWGPAVAPAGSWRRRSPNSAGRTAPRKSQSIPVDVRDVGRAYSGRRPGGVQGSAARLKAGNSTRYAGRADGTSQLPVVCQKRPEWR